MRRLLITGFLLLFRCTLFAGERPKIGVMKFDVAANIDPQLGGFLYEVLLDRVVSSGKYTVVDWEQIDRVLRYIEASQPNVSEEDARRQAGNQLGIEQMYVGSLRWRVWDSRPHAAVGATSIILYAEGQSGCWMILSAHPGLGACGFQ